MKKIINIKRFERKFIFKLINQFEIQNLLYKSNFFFKPHYPSRKVNSIYFDTKSLKNINENLDGISDRKKFRVRNNLKKVSKEDRYRLSVSRSSKNISAQIIDDNNNITVLSASSKDKSIKSLNKKNKTELSQAVAEILAKKAIEKKITKIYFDRGFYKYHGRVKTFADTLRKNGMEF